MQVRGNGSLIQLDKTKSPYRCKKWRLFVTTSRGRKSKRYDGSRQNAINELNKFINQLENDEYINKKKFSDYSEYWYNYRKNTNELSPNTLKTDIKYVKKLNNLFSTYNLTDLTPKIIRDKISSATWDNDSSKKLSGTSKNHMYFTLNQILSMAEDDELIHKNPCRKVKPPKKDTLKKRALNSTEIKYLLNCLSKEPFDGRVMFIYFLLLLGLRRGEAVALTWSDWDKSQNLISINKAYKEANSSVGETKTRAGNRILPIPQQLSDILYKWENLVKLNRLNPTNICCNTKGNMLTGGSCYKWWKDFKTKYNIPNICYHELRHTNLTVMKNHLNVFDLKDYAGWEDIEMARVYIHKSLETMREGISQVQF